MASATKDAAQSPADADAEEEAEVVCGLGRFCSPRWLQRLATKQMFLCVFCLTCILQGMFFTYFVSVLTTIEKLFQVATALFIKNHCNPHPTSVLEIACLKKRRLD